MWTLVVETALVQSRYPSYYSMQWSHTPSYAPNAALCPLQPFEEIVVRCGIGLHHRDCYHARNRDSNQHFRWSVTDR